jgi:hypothetical protein
MENIIGIPVSLLFSIIGGFGVYIFLDFKKQCADKFRVIESKISKIDESSKELSRQEFEEIKGYVKESINIVINSKDFRDDLKGSINDILLHIDSNRSKGEAAIYAHFEAMLNDINHKLTQR